MFDILGRLAIDGIWAYWFSTSVNEEYVEFIEKMQQRVLHISDAIKRLIYNNPVLLLPIKDEQAIDIAMAILLLFTDLNNKQFVLSWLASMVEHADLAYSSGGYYP
ncbi:hypothetical protein, partial [Haemophilus parainfluenzae]|uniref:hypothetical protein n=1 Tax=Haemophilus parainfluenzae TaxID=729 RepID=UPI001CEDB3F7